MRIPSTFHPGRAFIAWLSGAITAICIACHPCAAEIILPFGSSWEYLHPTDGIDPAIADADFSTTWHTPAEYDGTAFNGPAPGMLGYGEIDGQTIATDISTPASGDRYSAYFRTTITTTQDYDWLEFEIFANDGGVLYIDGEAVAVLNYLGEDNYYGLAADEDLVGGARKVAIDGLQAGEHVIAFSLHGESPDDLEIGFDLQMIEIQPSPAIENLSWTSANGEVTITDSSADVEGVLHIPDTIDGMPVTSIGIRAFRNKRWVYVSIPDGVSSIGAQAFSGCSSLISVSIPDGVTSIESDAFYGCRELKSVIIPNGVTSIEDRAFSRCSSLTGMSIPHGVTSIGRSAFYECSSLTGLILPGGMTSIEGTTFSGCSSLTSVSIPNYVKTIGVGAFLDCGSLTDIVIPDSVTSIGALAFQNCSSLPNISLGVGLTSIGIDAFQNTGIVYQGAGALKYLTNSVAAFLVDASAATGDLILPDQFGGLPVLSVNAFRSNTDVTSVTIPDGVTEIGRAAFSDCVGLTNVSIPDSVTRIDGWAFSGCSSLTSVIIPDGVTSLEFRAFYACLNLERVTIPQSVTNIGNSVFQFDYLLKSVTFLGAAPEFGYDAFSNVSAGARAFVNPEHLASFGGENAIWNGLVVRPIPIMKVAEIGKVFLDGDSFTISFSGEASVTDWRIVGSSALDAFDDDITAASQITEITPGEYEAMIDVTGNLAPYFIRVER